MKKIQSLDDKYLAIILDALAVCKNYKPKFGKGAKAGFSLTEFQKLYQFGKFFQTSFSKNKKRDRSDYSGVITMKDDILLEYPTKQAFHESSQRREHLTFRGNVRNGRHGWLRLTPAFSLHVV